MIERFAAPRPRRGTAPDRRRIGFGDGGVRGQAPQHEPPAFDELLRADSREQRYGPPSYRKPGTGMDELLARDVYPPPRRDFDTPLRRALLHRLDNPRERITVPSGVFTHLHLHASACARRSRTRRPCLSHSWPRPAEMPRHSEAGLSYCFRG
jgi:hypothetical protein